METVVDHQKPPPQPPSVVIIAGPSGSGKSTVGAEVARRIGYNFVDGDNFHSEANKAKMGKGQPLNDDDRKEWLTSLTALCHSSSLDQQKLVVACSALKRKYRQILLGDSPGTDRMVALLNVSEEVLRQRMDNRKAHFAKSDLIKSQLATLELPGRPEEEPNLLVLDGSQSVEEVVSEVLRKLNFIDENKEG